MQADVERGTLPATVVEELSPKIDALAKSLPQAYNIAVGGTVEESAKSQASVIAMVPIMLLTMLTILMIELRSFQHLFLVLTVGPLGLIGVVAALLLSGKPLGFVAILGVLALLGIITKNAVILIGQIEAERSQGKDVWRAVVDASGARFRYISLKTQKILVLLVIDPRTSLANAFAVPGILLAPVQTNAHRGRSRASWRSFYATNSIHSRVPWQRDAAGRWRISVGRLGQFNRLSHQQDQERARDTRHRHD